MVHGGRIAKCALPFPASAGAIALREGGDKEFKIMVNYNGQADLLLSLQIPPDYYPYQFKRNNIYGYLTQIRRHIVSNQYTSEEKKNIKNKLQKRINDLLKNVEMFGDGLWDKSIYESGLMFRNDNFWNTKKTHLLFLEQFVLDDYTNMRENYELLPVHKNLIVTNHRAARDPYTVFSRETYECMKQIKTNENLNCPERGKNLAINLNNYVNEYKNNHVNALYRYGKYIHFGNNLNELDEFRKGVEEWTYKNDGLFSEIKDWDIDLAQKFQENIFSTEDLRNINSGERDGNIEYLKARTRNRVQLMHHPVLEHQKIPGTVPISEGSQKDMMIFMYQFAALIDKYVKDDDFEKVFGDDYRKEFMQTAIKSTQKISKNLKDRLRDIRKYFQRIGVVDPNYDPTDPQKMSKEKSKSFGILNFSPRNFGIGESSIMTISKYPFIYHDIGLKQEFPKSFLSHHSGDEHHEHNEELEEEIFGVDDNGWWGNLGNANIRSDKVLEFQKKFDKLLIIANKEDGNLISNGIVKHLSPLMKDKKFEGSEIFINKINTKKYAVSYSDHNLWNEGVRSPIALNLLLDNLVEIFQKQYDHTRSSASNEYSKAMDWGDYWSDNFVNGTPVK